MAKKDYHKPPEDPRTIGGGLKAQGRARREKLQAMIRGAARQAGLYSASLYTTIHPANKR